MIVAIHAMENIYGGLHGIENFRVIEVENIDEAREIAISDSREVMESFGIIEEMEVDLQEQEISEEDLEFCLNDAINENIEFEIWEVVDNYADIRQMDSDFYNDCDEFVAKHCKPLE